VSAIRSERVSRSVTIEDTYAATVECPDGALTLDGLLNALVRAKAAGQDGDAAVTIRVDPDDYTAAVTVQAVDVERPMHPGAEALLPAVEPAALPLGHEFEGGEGDAACYHRTYDDDPAEGYRFCAMTEEAHRG
jgi:hypothetical protein